MTRRIALLTGSYAALGGIISLAGWALDIRRLTDWENNGISIQPNATICVIVSGLAVLALATNQFRVTAICGALVLSVGGLTLLQWVSGLSFGIDSLLMFGREWGRSGVVVPGRMGPPGSFSWTLIGAALVLSAGPPRPRRWAPALALTTTAVGALSLIGYLYGVDQLYALPYLTVIALQTSTFVMAVSVGIIVSHPEREPMRILLDPGGAGLLARRALPLMLLVPIVLGFFRVKGQAAGLYDTGLGSGLVALITIAFLTGLMWWALHEVRMREQALRASEAREVERATLLQTVLDTSPSPIWVALDSRCVRIVGNPAADALLGSPHGANVSMNAAQDERYRYRCLRDGADVPAEMLPMQRAAREGVTVGAEEYEIIRGDGTRVWLLMHASPLVQDGQARGAIAVAVDITRRKQAEVAVRESEALFRTMGEAVPDFLWMADAEGRPIYQNPAWRQYVGMTQEELAARGWEVVHHPEDVPALQRVWTEAVGQGKRFQVEARTRRHDGDYRWFAGRTVPLKDDSGRVIKWVGTMTDIHDRKTAEEALKEADRRKDEFLATLAHELRNPLAPIRNAVQVLHMKGPAVPELQWARDVIDRQMQQMTRLIDDLMDVSRISRGKIELKRERTALAMVIQGAVEMSRPLIEQCGHELTVALTPQPVHLDADMTRLAQVFANLLNNAAKYTERGGVIQLTAERQGSDVVVSVRDSGIGIPRDKLRSVFELFAQVEGALDRSQGGLGVGLSLVKGLVEMHDGTIEARSEGLGMGSEFVVRLPLVVEQPGVADRWRDEEREVWASSLRILIVDDNRDAAHSLGMIFRSMGNEIRMAYDGDEAVRAAGEFRPRVMLLDIGLPKLNGYEVCRRIRQEPWGKCMVLIAMTGWGQEEDKRRAEDAGFDRHLVKPVDPRVLLRLLGSLPAEQAGYREQ